MRSALRHPPPAAARTEGPAFAGKSDKPLVPARRTPEPGEARREASTRKKVFERPFHKPREALAVIEFAARSLDLATTEG
jgi:hypothetical protein